MLAESNLGAAGGGYIPNTPAAPTAKVGSHVSQNKSFVFDTRGPIGRSSVGIATHCRNVELQIEKVGAMMPWISKGKMVDRARN